MLSLSEGAAHNSFYIQRDITSWYQDGSLWDRIAGRNGYERFEGIFPGSYFSMSRPITAPGSSAGGSATLLITSCNLYGGAGLLDNGEIVDIDHGIYYTIPRDLCHITVCPYFNFGEAKMNDTDTTVGGYWGSKMNQEILGLPTTTGDIGGTINQQLYAEFGNHLIAWKDRFTTDMNPDLPNRIADNNDLGATSGFSWKLHQTKLLSEIEVYGSIVFSSSGFDTGCSNYRFPTFSHSRNILQRQNFWLRDAASSTKFCFVQNLGTNGIRGASNIFKVKPSFVLA